jgi:hypothetical protein
MAEDLDVEALLEAPFQKKESENGRDKREDDDRKRSSEDKDERDSKRRFVVLV